MPWGGSGGGPGSSVGGASGDSGRGGSSGGGYHSGWASGNISSQIGGAVKGAFGGQNVSNRGSDSFSSGSLSRGGGSSSSDRAGARAERRSSVIDKVTQTYSRTPMAGLEQTGLPEDQAGPQTPESPKGWRSWATEMGTKPSMDTYETQQATDLASGYRSKRAATGFADVASMAGLPGAAIGGIAELGQSAYAQTQSPTYQAGSELGARKASPAIGAIGGALLGPFAGAASLAGEAIAQRETGRIMSDLANRVGLPGAEAYGQYARDQQSGGTGSRTPAPGGMADAATPQQAPAAPAFGTPDYSKIDYASGYNRYFKG